MGGRVFFAIYHDVGTIINLTDRESLHPTQKMAKIYRFSLLSRKHGSHHIAGVLSMICDRANYFSKSDQMTAKEAQNRN
jgi:hypothetical protein